MSTPPDAANLVKTAYVAARFAVTQRTVERWVAGGLLPAIRLGPGHGVLRFRREDVDAFEAANATNDRSAAA